MLGFWTSTNSSEEKKVFIFNYATDAEVNQKRFNRDYFITHFIAHESYYLKETALSSECPERYIVGRTIAKLEEGSFRYAAELAMSLTELKTIIQQFKDIPQSGDIFTLGFAAALDPKKYEKRQEIIQKLANNITTIQIDQKINGSWENIHEEHFELTSSCVLL